MVVDDDPEIRSSLGELLEDEGYEVVAACDGLEALRMLRNGDKPSVILLDLMMPNMDGWETARELRAGYRGGADPRQAIHDRAGTQHDRRVLLIR